MDSRRTLSNVEQVSCVGESYVGVTVVQAVEQPLNVFELRRARRLDELWVERKGSVSGCTDRQIRLKRTGRIRPRVEEAVLVVNHLGHFDVRVELLEFGQEVARVGWRTRERVDRLLWTNVIWRG